MEPDTHADTQTGGVPYNNKTAETRHPTNRRRKTFFCGRTKQHKDFLGTAHQYPHLATTNTNARGLSLARRNHPLDEMNAHF